MDFFATFMDGLADFLTSIPIQLLSAVFIFLFGLHFLAEGLKNAAQDKLKAFFNLAVKNRVMGAIFGTIITAVTQSSTAVTVMTIGFVNAGVMTLLQAASIIVGANIGTTLTSYIMTIRFDTFVPILMVLGGLKFLFLKKEKTKQVGVILFGFGLFFIGLTQMSDAMRPLRESQAFIDAIIWLDGRVMLGVLVGALMSGVLNSSTAAKSIIIMLAFEGIIDLNIAMPLIFGVNIGTCFTALLSSVQANKNAKRAALFHLLFSVLGTLIFLPFIPQYTAFIENIPWPGDTVYYQVANAHTIFNVVTAILFLFILTPVLKLINVFIKEDEVAEVLNPLDERLLENPAIAFDHAFKETLKMHRLAIENFETSTNALFTGNLPDLDAFYKKEETINQLEHDITNYISSIPSELTTEAQSNDVAAMIKIVNDIERIGDHATNIMEGAEQLKTHDAPFSEEAASELSAMYKETLNAANDAYESYKLNDLVLAARAIDTEDKINALEVELRDNHIKRLKEKACHVRSGLVFLDIISNFERVGDHSKNIVEYVMDSKK